MKLVLGITGASGIPIAIRAAEVLAKNYELYTVVSDGAKRVMDYEVEDKDETLTYLKDLSTELFGEEEMAAPIASGSFQTEGMVITPCSMKTLGALAAGIPRNLVERAADVCLKEGRKLVLVPRETPLSQIHLENMAKLKKAGAEIVPPVLGFYFEPESKQDFVDYIVGKLLERLGHEHDLYQDWQP